MTDDEAFWRVIDDPILTEATCCEVGIRAGRGVRTELLLDGDPRLRKTSSSCSMVADFEYKFVKPSTKTKWPL